MPRKATGRTGNLDTQDGFKVVISHFSVYQSSHTRMCILKQIISSGDGF